MTTSAEIRVTELERNVNTRKPVRLLHCIRSWRENGGCENEVKHLSYILKREPETLVGNWVTKCKN